MNKKATVAAGGLGSFFFVIAFAGLISAREICACATVDITFTAAFEASPLRAPEALRTKLLKKLPPGTTVDEMYMLLGRVARLGTGGLEPASPVDYSRDIDVIDMRKRCAVKSAELTCRFLVEEEWWALKKTGFDIHASLDASNLLKDLRVVPFSEWGK